MRTASMRRAGLAWTARRRDDRRRDLERNHRDCVRRGRPPDGVARQRLRPLEAPRRAHAERTVDRDDARGRRAAADAKYGRANAAARSSSAATRAASSSRSRSRCRRVCSSGERRSRRTAVNGTSGATSRRSRCSTIGIAMASAPARKSGYRNDTALATSAARACSQVGEQREIERLRRVELHVVDAGAAQLAVVAQRQAGQLAQVGRPHGGRVRQ